jgi:hypothetical protein
MNVEIGTEAAQFPEKEYINGIFVAVWIMMYKGQRYTDYIRRLQRVVVCLGWPVWASSYMSDRLETKRQNAGGAGYQWLCTPVRMEPN